MTTNYERQKMNNELTEIFQKVMNSENWDFVFELFHRFFNLYKGYKIIDPTSYYHGLHTDLFLEYYMDKRIMYSPNWTNKDSFNWFIAWLKKYEDFKLTDKDLFELKKIKDEIEYGN